LSCHAQRRRPFLRYGPGIPMILVFVSSSWALWAFMFAYQRYLVPVELLLGPVIWILLDCLFGIERRVAAGLALCFVVAMTMLRTPDWGHIEPEQARTNPFGLDLPEQLARTPAEYLVVGVPIGYV